MELKRDLIIKALECCADEFAECTKLLLTDALSLIKELTEKVENYRNELGEVRFALAEANNDKKELTEENERLREELAQRPPKLIITKVPKKESKNV